MRISLIFIVLVLAAVVGRAALPEGGLFKPTFMAEERSFTAGTAFLMKISVAGHRHLLLVTCFHVLDNKPQEIRSAAALSLNRADLVLLAPRVVPIKGAAAFTGSNAEGELAVFAVDSLPSGSKPLSLAAAMPQPGETVWLYGKVFQTEAPKHYRGRVVRVTAGLLEYVLDDAALELGGTSGAPVLNERGEVVGINVGGMKYPGRLHAMANPVSAFRPKIREALSALR